MGRVVSVNVGQPRQVRYKSRTVTTSFFKQPVDGPVRVGPTNLEGDAQADLRVHGGPFKAVYAYASEHYPAWQRRLGTLDLPWGSFGENLTLEGFLEDDVRVGDRIRVGTALLAVTDPREPCFKMNVRFGRDDMVKLFAQAARPGFYCQVLQTGEVQAGDVALREAQDPDQPTIVQVFRQSLGQEG